MSRDIAAAPNGPLTLTLSPKGRGDQSACHLPGACDTPRADWVGVAADQLPMPNAEWQSGMAMAARRL
jgi:hypothetical protein